MPRTAPSFLLADEVGGFKAWELWRYATGIGKTPREALDDPELAFGLSVMRGHDRFQREMERKAEASLRARSGRR